MLKRLRKALANLFYYVSILWGVVTLCFFLFFVFPDSEEIMMGQRSDPQTREAIRKQMGLDQSVAVRYAQYINRLSPISFYQQTQDTKGLTIPLGFTYLVFKTPDLGSSFKNKKQVSSILKEALTGTLVLAGTAMFIALILGISLGIISASVYQSALDKSILIGSTLFISVPSFFSAILIAWFFGYIAHAITGLNMTGSLYMPDPQTGNQVLMLQNLILPCLALSLRPVAVITQLMRSSMLQELKEDYIRTARAKGLHPRIISLKHALINAVNPVITAASGWFASMMAGAFFVEYIFNWKGLGKVLIDSVQLGDLPVASAGIVYIALIFICVQALVNMSYIWVDPKLRYPS